MKPYLLRWVLLVSLRLFQTSYEVVFCNEMLTRQIRLLCVMVRQTLKILQLLVQDF